MRAHCTGRVTTQNLASAIWPAYWSVEARLHRGGSGGGGMSMVTWKVCHIAARYSRMVHPGRFLAVRQSAPTGVTAEVAVDGTDFNAFRKKYHCEISQRLAKLQAKQEDGATDTWSLR